MQSFKPSMRERGPLLPSPPAPHNSSLIMPPPPPPPLISQTLKRFDSKERMQISRSSSNHFPKFSSQLQFIPPPPPLHIQQPFRSFSSTFSQKSKSQGGFELQRHDIEVNKSSEFIQPRKPQPFDTTLKKSEEVAGGSQNIVDRSYNSAKEQKEMKPNVSEDDNNQVKINRKRHAEKTFDDTDGVNSGLPKELTKKFGPLKCDLCCVAVNSTLQAKMHYSGKLHEKKVKSFLQTWSLETGEPLPKQFSGGQSKKQTPETSYCDVCDIVLTSAAHEVQHKLGRSHRRAVANRTLVTKKKEENSCPADDPTGRFGIGLQFHPRDNPDVLGLMSEEINSASSKSKKLFCELCQVAATCKEQLLMHLKGARHRKAENASKIKSPGADISLQASQSSSLLDSVNSDDSAKVSSDKDYSVYRTPSGCYYCKPCNLTLNSEAQFIQHCQSKKHNKKTQQ